MAISVDIKTAPLKPSIDWKTLKDKRHDGKWRKIESKPIGKTKAK